MLLDPQNTQLGQLCQKTMHQAIGQPPAISSQNLAGSRIVQIIQDLFQLQGQLSKHVGIFNILPLDNSTSYPRYPGQLHSTSILYHQNDVQKPVSP